MLASLAFLRGSITLGLMILSLSHFALKSFYFTFLGSKFELKNGLVFDKDSLCVRKDNEVIYLGKKESQLLEILCKNSPHVVTYDEIDHHLYKNETLSQDRIRSLVREIRAKIPTICLKNRARHWV